MNPVLRGRAFVQIDRETLHAPAEIVEVKSDSWISTSGLSYSLLGFNLMLKSWKRRQNRFKISKGMIYPFPFLC